MISNKSNYTRTHLLFLLYFSDFKTHYIHLISKRSWLSFYKKKKKKPNKLTLIIFTIIVLFFRPLESPQPGKHGNSPLPVVG